MSHAKQVTRGASCTSANVAHIIFLTTDVSFSKSLAKALPDRVFRQISLGDCSPDLARRFVLSHLETDDSKPASPMHFLTKPLGNREDGSAEEAKKHQEPQYDMHDLDRCLTHLGGRLTDLEFLARRIKAGETPQKAVREIIDQSASEILKIYVLNASKNAPEAGKWTSAQAWTLVKLLAKSEEGILRYNEMILDDTFKGAALGPDAILQSLEQAELISIASSNGRPVSIKPGKPVFLPAFRQLAEDKVLNARMEVGLLGDTVKGENGTIAKCEDELLLLGKLPKQPAELSPRIQYLLAKIEKSQRAIEEAEHMTTTLKKVLQTDF